jgi:LSD1 subclass zinc finger protein
MARTNGAARRRILCTSCDLPLEVATEAKSVNCVHCNTRVITEEMTVGEYVAVRRFSTANRMRITKKGKVYASVRADALEVDGFLQGDAVALEGIRLSRRARRWSASCGSAPTRCPRCSTTRRPRRPPSRERDGRAAVAVGQRNSCHWNRTSVASEAPVTW